MGWFVKDPNADIGRQHSNKNNPFIGHMWGKTGSAPSGEKKLMIIKNSDISSLGSEAPLWGIQDQDSFTGNMGTLEAGQEAVLKKITGNILNLSAVLCCGREMNINDPAMRTSWWHS